MPSFNKSISYFIFLFFIGVQVNAYEYTNEYRFDIEAFKNKLIASANQLISINEPENKPHEFYAFKKIVKLNCNNIEKRKPKQEIIKAKLKDLDKSYGLSFESGIGYSREVDSDNETKAYLGLSYDFLNNGLREFKYRKKQLHAEFKKEELEKNFNNQTCKTYAIDYYFDKEIQKNRNLKKEIFFLYKSIAEKNYFNGKILYNELLQSESEYSLFNNNLKKYNFIKKIYPIDIIDGKTKLPIPGRLKIDLLLNNEKTNIKLHKLKNLNKEIIENRYKAKDLKRLYLYARTGASRDDDSSSVGDFSAGLRLRIPLGNSVSNQLETELKLIEYDRDLFIEKHIDNIIQLSFDYSDKLEKALKKFYLVKISQEKVRLSLINLKYLGDEAGLYELLKNILNLIDKKTDFLESKKDLYNSLSNLFSKTFIEPEKSYFSKINFKEFFYRKRPQERTIYSWSKSFNVYSNSFIIDSLKAKRINTIAVSAGKKTDKDKLLDFINKTKKTGIKTQLLIGNNSVLTKKNKNSFYNRIKYLYSLSDSIHLDIEPHAVNKKDFSEKALWIEYEKIIKNTYKLKKENQKLIISIPFKTTKKTIQNIKPFTDVFYIMAYSVKDPEKMAKRLKKFINIIPGKIVIAIRPIDFNSEYEMEVFIKNIEKLTKINRFAIHGMEEYYKLAGALYQ